MEKLLILEQIAPFNRLDQKILMQVRNMLQEKEYPKGSFFFRQGDPSLKTLFILIDGIAEIAGRNEQGVESVVGLRKPYDFFGETVILSEKRYPASVKAVTDCKCLLLDRETFDYLIHNSTEFSSFFSELLTDRLRGLFKQVVQEQTYSAYGTDAQPFRKRVCDVMTTPVVTCKVSDTVTQAAKTLSAKDVSSLVVVDDSVVLICTGNLFFAAVAAHGNPAIIHRRSAKPVDNHFMLADFDDFSGQTVIKFGDNLT